MAKTHRKSASHRNAPRKLRPRSKPVKRPVKNPPDLALPFVKTVGAQGVRGSLDYWAPPDMPGEDSLAAEYRGGLYALLTIRHLASDPSRSIGSGVIGWIIGAMVDKRRFWAIPAARGKLSEPDSVAIGFVSTLAQIALIANQHGVVTEFALRSGARLAHEAKKQPSRSMPKEMRAILKKASEERFAFASEQK